MNKNYDPKEIEREAQDAWYKNDNTQAKLLDSKNKYYVLSMFHIPAANYILGMFEIARLAML